MSDFPLTTCETSLNHRIRFRWHKQEKPNLPTNLPTELTLNSDPDFFPRSPFQLRSRAWSPAHPVHDATGRHRVNAGWSEGPAGSRIWCSTKIMFHPTQRSWAIIWAKRSVKLLVQIPKILFWQSSSFFKRTKWEWSRSSLSSGV